MRSCVARLDVEAAYEHRCLHVQCADSYCLLGSLQGARVAFKDMASLVPLSSPAITALLLQHVVPCTTGVHA